MDDSFEVDRFPGKLKILFIGIPSSTHTHAWIDLFSDAEFNVRLFSASDVLLPPKDWRIPTYITRKVLPNDLDLNIRKSWYPSWQEWNQKRSLIYWIQRVLYKFWDITITKSNMPINSIGQYSENAMFHAVHLAPKTSTIEEWLAQIIHEWQPTIIHTLGLDPASILYYKARKKYNLAGIGKWILQLWGGSDLSLNRMDPEIVKRLSPILHECDQLVSDNLLNFSYALEMDVKEEQLSPISPIPGIGGIDLDQFSEYWEGRLQKERVIIWPKAYDCLWSKALPVFEAIKMVWDDIQPCTIHMLAMTEETRLWFNTLPEYIRQHCHVYDRIPRKKALDLLIQARVMLAPTLVDGIPNSLYEAMAAGALPIVSPLETIAEIAEDEINVLFARNLYPNEIADALTRAMNDDGLVERVIYNNNKLVHKLADRTQIVPKVVSYYKELA